MSPTFFNLFIILGWALSVIYSLVKLRQTPDSTARAIWALVIILIPFLGALAFLLVEFKHEAL